jgi:hypothetical protein
MVVPLILFTPVSPVHDQLRSVARAAWANSLKKSPGLLQVRGKNYWSSV